MPLGTRANIKTDQFTGSGHDDRFLVIDGQAGADNLGTHSVMGAVGTSIASGDDLNLYADLTNATSATINAMRVAVTTQQFLERDARGGTRANEIIRSHFGVVVPDYRAVYPEYLGGSTDPINIQTIPQTSQTATTPLGTTSALATLTSNSSWSKSFTEFGLIMGIANVRADITYQKV